MRIVSHRKKRYLTMHSRENSQSTNRRPRFKRNVHVFQIIGGGKCLENIMHLKHTLILRTNAYETFGHDKYFRIYILCVHPSYRGKGIELGILNACVQVARTLKMPAIGGIFTSGESQSFAESCGFRQFAEIHYSQWIVNERVIFDDPGRGNYSVAFMGMLISHEEDPKENQVSLLTDGRDGKSVKII